MLESGRRTKARTPRRNHWVVPEPDLRARLIKINSQAIADYRNSLTQFLRNDPFDPSYGCLIEGRPIFYCDAPEVIFFGHTRNFRIPARLPDEKRAATPWDFVPGELRREAITDLADAIFGWTPEPGGERRDSRAGRVFVGDARMESASSEVWSRPITPHVLSGPKPTTFQNYLVQDASRGHDPDERGQLAHYATSREEAQIRGHKMYWHKDAQPDIEATAEEKEHETQLTRITPLNPGVTFKFRIWFENLRAEEVGAVLWVLKLPNEAGREYRHKLGMGKPLGMGAVAISVRQLRLHDRRDRYTRLFDGKGEWHLGAEESLMDFVGAYERFVMKQLGKPDARLVELERIRMMLRLLEWPGPSTEWTRYMQIEHAEYGNEYKERPVLPNPFYAENTPQAVQERPPARQVSFFRVM
jgi:CRISPR-associated protein (TIGR03986 family)